MNQIHGHEVLQMMLSSGETYTKQSLTVAIINRFGADTRFHTCSAEDLTAEQLVEFLDARGKLVQQNGGLQTSADLLCRHQD
jgi:probable metal-binding protein